MPYPLAIIVMVAMLAAGYYYIRFVTHLFMRALTTVKARGYKSPALLTAAGVVVFALPFIGTLATLGYGDENGLWVVMGLFVAFPASLRLVARRLPARNPRTAGRRRVRFPYRLAGYALCALAVVLWITAAATSTNGIFQAGTFSMAAGLGAIAIARRAAQPDAAAVLARDPRPPVIYLRPFEQDQEIFAKLPWNWRNYRLYLRQILMRRKSLHMTLEDFLSPEIANRIGPFVALGNPLDFVPPDGAARAYVADEEWPKHFADMVRRARCMVLLAASSEHVMWELKEIRALGLESKLFVLTRPKLTAGTKIATWGTFAASLRRAGYPSCGDAGPGAVVTFKPGGEPVTLKRDAKTAGEIVDAILRRIL
jgi:hypothetical protein